MKMNKICIEVANNLPLLFKYACVHGCGALKGLKMSFGTFTATAVENIFE